MLFKGGYLVLVFSHGDLIHISCVFGGLVLSRWHFGFVSVRFGAGLGFRLVDFFSALYLLLEPWLKVSGDVSRCWARPGVIAQFPDWIMSI